MSSEETSKNNVSYKLPSNAITSRDNGAGKAPDNIPTFKNNTNTDDAPENATTSQNNGNGKAPDNTKDSQNSGPSETPNNTKRLCLPEFFICAGCKGPGLKNCDAYKIPSACQHILHLDCILIWYENDDVDPHDEWPCGCPMTASEMEYIMDQTSLSTSDSENDGRLFRYNL
ncbi:hypothetical protein K440DRAFT_638517 [Wilcoxina mikolae CBS 423.85]|nr:hypothetical protein K440DRAFT_638517 [Wilcoxina mikolae CBS 423.85]